MAACKVYWQELTTTSHSSCPKLFYKFTSQEDGYELLVTDLIGLWLVRADAEATRTYARRNRTSIDPTGAQFEVLLEKLQQSLRDGTNILYRDDDSEDESLVLKTTIKLPKPLQPLEWQFYLQPEGAGEMAEHILRPSLHEASESKRKLDSLIDIIKQKDHVISKLLERIENSSTDLSLIFPRITSLKSRKGIVTTKDAQAQVPGLATFNRKLWDDKFRSESAYAGFETHGLSNLMAGCEKCPKHTAKQHEKWLQKLPGIANDPIDEADEMQLGGIEAGSGNDTSTGSESDEFETQPRKQPAGWQADGIDSSYNLDSNEERPNKQVKLTTVESSISQNNVPAQSSPVKSSSPILPPQPETDLRRNSTASTTSAASQDLVLPTTLSDTTKHARLGKIGNQPKPISKLPRDPTLPSSDYYDSFFPPPASSSPPRKPQSEIMSSSPPPLPPPLPPPPPPPQLIKNTKNTQSILRSSSPLSSSLNPPSPRKLRRLNSTSKQSRSATPQDPPNQKQSSNEPSAPPTPSRRLGRLGQLSRTTSNLASQSQSQSQSQLQIQNRQLPNPIEQVAEDNENANDTDASTASTASTPPPPEEDAQLSRASGSSPSRKHGDESGSWQLLGNAGAGKSGGREERKTQLQVQPQPQLSAEEKARLRREELKRKIGGDGAGAQGMGLRKKRKF